MRDYSIKNRQEGLTEQELTILRVDPFPEDKGDNDITVFRDVFVNRRTSARCAICRGWICKGQRVRKRVEKFDGMVKSFLICPICCATAYRFATEDSTEAEDAWFDRYELGIMRAN